MAGEVRSFGTLVWRVANGGGTKGEFIYRKTRQTQKWLFFVRKL
jgi:hypothetical protein